MGMDSDPLFNEGFVFRLLSGLKIFNASDSHLAIYDSDFTNDDLRLA